MDSFWDYLDKLEDVIENSKSSPFSNKVSVDKDQIFDILSDMRMNVPDEIRRSQRVLEEHDKILQDAKFKSENILRDAEIQVQELTDQHEIYRLAVEQARVLMEDAKKSAREMNISAIDYADEILLKTENAIRESLAALNEQYRTTEESFLETVDVLYSNRQELRGNKG